MLEYILGHAQMNVFEPEPLQLHAHILNRSTKAALCGKLHWQTLGLKPDDILRLRMQIQPQQTALYILTNTYSESPA